MFNIGKIVVFIITLLLATVSLAITCASDDADCGLNQKKMQLMDKMGIKPVETKNQPNPNADKQPIKSVPFQIPPPGDSQGGTSNQSARTQDNSGFKIPDPMSQDNVPEQEAVPQPQLQQPKIKSLVVQSVLQPVPQIPQPQTSIYR